MAKAFQKLVAAYETGEIGETFIRGFRMALHAADRREQGYSVGSTSPGMTVAQGNQLMAAIATKPPRIDAKQSAKGLAWLQSRKVQRALGARERDIVANFDHFTLADMIDTSRTSVAFYVPVYCVHAKDGRTFAYYVGSWQSGVPLTVVS